MTRESPFGRGAILSFLQEAVIGGKSITTFVIPVRVPLNVYNTSRENAARMNLSKQLELMSATNLSLFLAELVGLASIDTEWPICLFSCGEANHIIFSVSEIAQAVSGEIEARKKTPATSVSPSASPTATSQKTPITNSGASTGINPSFIQGTIFWGGIAAVVILLARQFQGGTKRA